MCYAVPLVSAAAATVIWRANKNPKLWWLNLMLYGGALFGVIDHLWNGELFLISGNIVSDLLLGVVITAFIIISWAAILIISRSNPILSDYIRVRS